LRVLYPGRLCLLCFFCFGLFRDHVLSRLHHGDLMQKGRSLVLGSSFAHLSGSFYRWTRFLGALMMLLPLAVRTVIRCVPILLMDPVAVWNGLGLVILTRSPMAKSRIVSVGVGLVGETVLVCLGSASVSRVRRAMTSVCCSWSLVSSAMRSCTSLLVLIQETLQNKEKSLFENNVGMGVRILVSGRSGLQSRPLSY
jgi:hypothetical protein